MLKKFNIKNRKAVNIISISLIVLVLIGIISAVLLIKPKDYKTIDNSQFVIGKITDNGEFMKSDDYVCTNDLIACDDLSIKPTFNVKSKYQIFFYDSNYKFVYKTDALSKKFDFIDSVPFVEYCRIMIIPDRGDKSADEFKITIFNKSNYVNEFVITVNKEQVIGAYKDYFEKDEALTNMAFSPNWSDFTYSYKECENVGVSKVIDLTGVDSFYFVTDKVLSSDDTYFICLFLDDRGKVSCSSFGSACKKIHGAFVYKVECKDYSSIVFNYYLDSDCHLYLDKGNK